MQSGVVHVAHSRGSVVPDRTAERAPRARKPARSTKYGFRHEDQDWRIVVGRVGADGKTNEDGECHTT